MSIRSKLTIMFLAVALVPIVVVGFVTFANYRRSLETGFITHLQRTTAFKADRVEKYFAELKADLELARSSYAVQTYLPVLNRLSVNPAGPEFQAIHLMLRRRLERMRRAFGLREVMLVNPAGRIVCSANPDRRRDNLLKSLPDPGEKSFREGKKGFYLTDSFPGAEGDDPPRLLMSGPVYQPERALAGVVVFEISMASVYACMQDVSGLGRTEESLLGKKVGEEVLYLSPLKYEQDAALNKRMPLAPGKAMPIQYAAGGVTGAGLTRDYRGVEVVAAWRYLPSLDWGLVSKIDSREAFAPVSDLRNLIILIMAIVFVLSGVLAFSMAQSIGLPLKRLSESAAIIGRGNLDHKVAVSGRDEIGRLAVAFDRMTQSLKKTIASRDDLDREIAERRTVERELARQREELQTIFDSVSALIFYKDRENRFLRVNRVFAEEMGMSKAGLENKSLYELYPRKQADEYWRDDLEVIASGRPKLSIVEVINTARGERWVQLDKIPYRDAQGNIIGVIGFAVDITDRLRIEEALRKSQQEIARAQATREERERFFALLETLPVYVILLTSDYHVAFANRFFRERFGEDRGRRCYEYLFNRQSPCENCETYKVLQDKQPRHWEWKGPDGRDYDVHDFPFVDTDGSVHIMEMGIDITDRKRAEAALLATQLAMEEAKRLSDIGTLAATVAHELRNPLAAISIAVANIRRKVPGDLISANLANVDKKVYESEQIINNLLFYSRLRPPRRADVILSTILEECVEAARGKSAGKVLIELNCDAVRGVSVSADALQLGEVFNNILDNAIDAVPETGGLITVGAEPAGDSVRVLVRDNGSGIEPEILEQVFDPFFTTKTKGTGLGLPVCRQIVGMHGGSMRIESESGRGTVVSVILRGKSAGDDIING